MRNLLHKFLAFASLIACGEKNEAAKSTLSDISPANMPVRSECLGYDVKRNKSVAVDWDDQTPLRVCLIQQTDGALGFDIRLRANPPDVRRQALNVELKSSNGRNAAGVFPLVWNPFNGIYELQLSQGCLVGTPGGCAVTAPMSMRHLFAALPHAEDGWRPNVQLTLSLVQPYAKGQTDSARFTFNWTTQSLKDAEREKEKTAVN